uniref:Uncharacterized protein n=1 Tax=Panagrolaimus davidi TaxID=227884 RepID=A0A914PWJ7_9BILA
MSSSPSKKFLELFKPSPRSSSESSSSSATRATLLKSAEASTSSLLEGSKDSAGSAGLLAEKYRRKYHRKGEKLISTSLGIRTKEGIILAAEKRANPKLLVNDSIEMVAAIDQHYGVTFAGSIADSRTLIESLRVDAESSKSKYNRGITIKDLAQYASNLARGDDDVKASMSRPFGVAMLFAGIDQNGPQLFHLDPSGTFIDCQAKSIGAASDGAEQNLKEQYHDNMALREALKVAMTILKQVMKDKLTSNNIEIVTITPTTDKNVKSTGEFKRLTNDELQALVGDL